MDDINLKELWGKQKTSPADMNDLLSRLNQLKTKSIRRIILTNVSLVLTGIFIVFIWIRYQPEFISTKIGIVLILLAMLVFIISNNKLFPLLNKINNLQSNADYIHSLITLKNKQQFIHKTILNLYFIMLSAGLALYMFEYTSRMSLPSAFMTYAITMSWIGFNWFYIRPKQIRKLHSKLEDILNKFESVNKQFKD